MEEIQTQTEIVKETKESKKDSKLKITLPDAPEHPFYQFVEELKFRRIKNLDLGELILEGLSNVDESWWKKKIDQLTPLEFRVDVALADPSLRDKLTEFLKTQTPDDNLRKLN